MNWCCCFIGFLGFVRLGSGRVIIVIVEEMVWCLLCVWILVRLVVNM